MQARSRTSWDDFVVAVVLSAIALVTLPLAMGEAVRIAGARLEAGEEALFIARAEYAQEQAASLRSIRPDLDLPTEAEVRRFAPIVERAARVNGVDEALVHAVIFAESSYDPRAVSPAGASGLMQLMPATAEHYGVRDLFDPAQNVAGGVRHLRDLLARFDGNVELALAAYNAGAGAVIRAGNRIPPRPETVAYVPKVIDYYRHFQSIRS